MLQTVGFCWTHPKMSKVCVSNICHVLFELILLLIWVPPVATRKLPLTNPPRTPTIISLKSLLSPEAEQQEGRPGLEEEDRLQSQLCCVDFSKPLPLLTTNSGTRSHTFCSVEMLEGKLQMQTLRKCQCTYYHSLPLIHIHAIFALCILAKPFQVHSTKYPMVINFLRQRLSLYNILQSVRLTSKASWPRWQVGNVVGNIQTRSVLPGRAHAFGYSAQCLKDTVAQPGVVWKNGGFSNCQFSVSVWRYLSPLFYIHNPNRSKFNILPCQTLSLILLVWDLKHGYFIRCLSSSTFQAGEPQATQLVRSSHCLCQDAGEDLRELRWRPPIILLALPSNVCLMHLNPLTMWDTA